MEDMSFVQANNSGVVAVAFNREAIAKRDEHEPDAMKLLQKAPELLEAFACASKAIRNNIPGSFLYTSLINGDVDEILVTVIVENPTMEINERIRKLVLNCHPSSEKLLDLVTFSL